MRTFTPVESALLLRLQSDFPLDERPFRIVGADLGLSEEETVAAALRFKEDGVLRDITGIFNADRLGYHTALLAFKVSAADLERTAAIVGSRPGVGHNYERDGEYNLWFTLAVERDVPMEAEAEALAALCGVGDFLVLRNERTLKIGVILPVGEAVPVAHKGEKGGGAPPKNKAAQSAAARGGRSETAEEAPTPDEREAVRVLQKDLPIEYRPFDALALRYGSPLGGTRLLAAARALRDKGIMRRYAAILRHRRAGYGVNIMSAWRLPAGGGSMLKPFIDEPLVTHLYLRSPIRGTWEHSLFAMMHAKSAEAGRALVEGLSRRSGLDDYLLLPTLREFKKKKIEYLGEPFSLLKRISP